MMSSKIGGHSPFALPLYLGNRKPPDDETTTVGFAVKF